MDPNANLEEQLELASKIIAADEKDPDDAVRLAELVLALDAWITRGNFLPKSWEAK